MFTWLFSLILSIPVWIEKPQDIKLLTNSIIDNPKKLNLKIGETTLENLKTKTGALAFYELSTPSSEVHLSDSLTTNIDEEEILNDTHLRKALRNSIWNSGKSKIRAYFAIQ